MIRIESLDHLVLTVSDIEASVTFYQKVLGMQPEISGAGRTALRFGNQKINLHEAGHEFEPKASRPTPGSADLCFITVTPLAAVIEHLNVLQVAIEEGPVARTGATGKILSVYCRDPDGNLIELAHAAAED